MRLLLLNKSDNSLEQQSFIKKITLQVIQLFLNS